MSEASEEVGDRIRAVIGRRAGVTEKRMFGGVGFMLHGNMVVGSMKDGSMLMRVGPERHMEALARPGCSPMIQGGKEMVGFILAADEATESDEDLKDSIEFAWSFVKTLPPKDETPARKAVAKKPAAKKPPRSR